MDFIDEKAIKTEGDLNFRAKKNLERIESVPYRPDRFFQDGSYN